MTHYCSYEEMSNRAWSWRGECRREHPARLSRRPTDIQPPAVSPTTPEGSPRDLLSCRPPAPSPPSGSSPSASLTADGSGARARLLPQDRGPLRSRRFSSSFLVQERSTPAGTCFFCPARRGESLLATSKHETAEPCRPASGERGIRAARGAEEDSDENCGIRWASNWHTLLPPAPGTAVEQDRGGRAWLCPSPSRAGPILGIHQEDKEPGRQAGVPGQPPAVPRPAAPSSDPHLPPAKGYSSAQTCSLQAIGSNCFQHQI